MLVQNEAHLYKWCTVKVRANSMATVVSNCIISISMIVLTRNGNNKSSRVEIKQDINKVSDKRSNLTHKSIRHSMNRSTNITQTAPGVHAATPSSRLSNVA